jgi:hypothetical protein
MKQYVEKIIHDKNLLEDKIKRTEKILSGEPYGMTDKSRELLFRQLVAMKDLLAIINERVTYEESR